MKNNAKNSAPATGGARANTLPDLNSPATADDPRLAHVPADKLASVIALGFTVAQVLGAFAAPARDTLSLGKFGNYQFTAYVGQKGGLCIRGLGRWPVTMYVEQAEAFDAMARTGAIGRAIEHFRSHLTTKGGDE
jgi:hypothetical protein